MKSLLILLALLPIAAFLEVHEDRSSNVGLEDLKSASEEGQKRVDSMIQLEDQWIAKGLTGKSRRPGHNKRWIQKLRSSSHSRQQSLEALRVIEASKELKDRLDLETNVLSGLSLKGTPLADRACWEPITCEPFAKYRSIDGSCNNLVNPHLGERGTTFKRLAPPQYADGVFSLRPASDGGSLPNPRQVLDRLISLYGQNDYGNVTLALMSFGQFVTHDLTYSEDYTLEDGSSPACCDPVTNQLPLPDQMHPMCASIKIDEHDIYYAMAKSNCMSVTRSKVGSDFSCAFGPAQQVNSNSHYLDGSQVYGSDAVTAQELRTGVDGLLKTSVSTDGRKLLPISPGCHDQVNKELAVCFQAGDVRSEENPQLTAFHLIMLREHNRIANELKQLNPRWDDERLYQETRRIVVAVLQHITYSEYLPIMLGREAMERYGLSTPETGYDTGYSADVDPSVANDFTAGAFRITHSSIQGFLELYKPNDEEDTDRSFTLSNYFFDASRLVEDSAFLDSALRGLTKQPPQLIDPFYTNELTLNLYKGTKSYGGDLVSITVQRGREHGIPGYNSFRQMCGLPRAETFDDLRNEVGPQELDNLKSYYSSVDDIDLYIGCLQERHVPGAKMGAVGQCLIADQFARTKKGDRFFYGYGGQSHSFTLAQLDQIRRASLARLLCDNNDGTVTFMQPAALISPIGTNERVPCSQIPSMDFLPWRE